MLPPPFSSLVLSRCLANSRACLLPSLLGTSCLSPSPPPLPLSASAFPLAVATRHDPTLHFFLLSAWLLHGSAATTTTPATEYTTRSAVRIRSRRRHGDVKDGEQPTAGRPARPTSPGHSPGIGNKATGNVR
ncbi:hypothetical protein GUJ93_ZPchr0002g23325 [Zizania palustris]|uniref:Uncharacterized protein n=1 Tax=Zizania palustris TaxID=103762 RepID=A0A8J5VA38_ZIZPA|nr:hypothetical protein GUJ93_ZPchr0002g23325 [Zizania palustris]